MEPEAGGGHGAGGLGRLHREDPAAGHAVPTTAPQGRRGHLRVPQAECLPGRPATRPRPQSRQGRVIGQRHLPERRF